MPTVLIGPSHLRNQPGRFRSILEEAGFQVLDPDAGPVVQAEILRDLLPGTDALLCGGEVMSPDMFALAPRLRVVARVGVGYDLVDLDAASAHKVPVTITPGTNQGSVAEQTFALLLALSRNVVANDANTKRGAWVRPLPRPLRGSTLGLVGMGRIGKAVASRASAFEMRIIACDALRDDEFDRRYGVERVSFDRVLEESDALSLHCPLTPETRGLMNRSTFARMKPGSYLINTARGGLVAEEDLYEALIAGHLGGAGLDVLDPEPPDPSNPLLSLPNVVFSPHIGGIDTKGMDDMATMAAETIVDLYRGRWHDDRVVNREIASGWKW